MTTSTSGNPFSFKDLQKISQGRKHYEVRYFPGKDMSEDHKIAVKVLSQAEIGEAYDAADRKIISNETERSKFDMLRSSSAYGRELERQILFRCIYTVPYFNEDTQREHMEPFFPSSDVIGKVLTLDETSVLMEYYNEIQERFSPTYSIKTEEDFTVIVEEIKKKSVRGMSLNMYELTGLVDYLVKNPEILLKDSGSTSSPSNKQEEKSKQEQQQPKHQKATLSVKKNQ